MNQTTVAGGIDSKEQNNINNKDEFTPSIENQQKTQQRHVNHKRQQQQKKQQQQQQLPNESVANATIIPKQENGCAEVINKDTAQQQMQQPQQQQQPKKVANPEKEKKIRNVAKKLSDIKKLKSRQDQGETLELNQLNKISMEAKFLEELKALKLSAWFVIIVVDQELHINLFCRHSLLYNS